MSTGGEDQASTGGDDWATLQAQVRAEAQAQAQAEADFYNVLSPMGQILDQIDFDPKQLPRFGRAIFGLPTLAANYTNFTISDPGIGGIINGISLGGSAASAAQLLATLAQYESTFVFRNSAEGVLENLAPQMNRALKKYTKHYRGVPEEFMRHINPNSYEAKAFQKFEQVLAMRKPEIAMRGAKALQALTTEGVISSQMVMEGLRGNLTDVLEDTVKQVKRDLKADKVRHAAPTTVKAYKLDVEKQLEVVLGPKAANYETFQKVMGRTATGLGYAAIAIDSSAAVAKTYKAYETFQDPEKKAEDVAEDLIDSFGSSMSATGGVMMLRPNPYLFGLGLGLTICGAVLQTTPVKQSVAPVATQVFNVSRAVSNRAYFRAKTISRRTATTARAVGTRAVDTAKAASTKAIDTVKSAATAPSKMDFSGDDMNTLNYSI